MGFFIFYGGAGSRGRLRWSQIRGICFLGWMGLVLFIGCFF